MSFSLGERPTGRRRSVVVALGVFLSRGLRWRWSVIIALGIFLRRWRSRRWSVVIALCIFLLWGRRRGVVVALCIFLRRRRSRRLRFSRTLIHRWTGGIVLGVDILRRPQTTPIVVVL
jgi:hypothetical protein